MLLRVLICMVVVVGEKEWRIYVVDVVHHIRTRGGNEGGGINRVGEDG